ncbi:hypothetical protein Mpe_A2913 [Methylibium petroleiphilum PM1]|uniref:Uncharacterized protein n=1 Tax=Methylibium petroleiphilum (strain ATCC BAA-1232 / LMG 22953 / PM1) TaxID=420662 RepID=A2SJX7_METPP|nr:hypothetical protein Mpe_A2913 [Methylibium petroleiphilum PM1]
MGVEAHRAAVVADGEIGVVVLAVGDPGHRVHEADGLVVVREAVGLLDRTFDERPADHRLQVLADLVGRHGAVGLRQAMLFGQLRHARAPIAANRSEAGGCE